MRLSLGLLALVALGACVGDDPSGAPGGSSGTSGGDPGRDGGNPAPGERGTITAITATGATLRRDGSAKIDVSVLRSADLGEVTVSASDLPRGVVANGIKLAPGINTTKLTLQANAEAVLGRKAITLTASADRAASVTSTVPLLVRGASGQLDTTFGKEGVVSFSDLGITNYAVASRFHEGTLYLVSGSTMALDLAAVTSRGAIATRFGAAAGKVPIPLPATWTNVANLPREISLDANGALAFGVSFRKGNQFGFSVFSIKTNEPTGALAPAAPSPFDRATVAVGSGIGSVFADANGGFFEVGVTAANQPPTPPLVPYIVRRSVASGAPSWTGDYQRVYGLGVGETQPAELGTETYGASPTNILLATAVVKGGKYYPRVFVQPRNGAAAVATTMPNELAPNIERAIGFSLPASSGEAWLQLTLSSGKGCFHAIRNDTKQPGEGVCYDASSVAGVFPLPNDRVAFLVNIGGVLVARMRRISTDAAVPGWDAPVGVSLGASTPGNISLVADDAEGLLLIDPRPAGGVRRYWD